MNLSFDAVTVAHFRSFAKAQTLDLSQPGLWFMRGQNEAEPALSANGAGKTSVWAAVCWCLYGKTPDGLKNPDIKPWSKSGIPEVTVSISVDGTSHRITRRAVTNGLSIDDVECGPDEAAKLIGLEYDVFINTILLAQGQPLFFDRPPKDKMQLFSDVLTLGRWDDHSARAVAQARELERLASEIAGEALGVEANLAQARELLETAREGSRAWDEARKGRAEALGTELKALEQLLEAQERRHGEATLSGDGAGAELKAARLQMPKLRAVLDAAKEALADETQRVRAAESEVGRLKRELAAFERAKVCPTCGQALKGKQHEHASDLPGKLAKAQKAAAKPIPKAVIEARDNAQCAVDLLTAHMTEFEEIENKAQTALGYFGPQVAELKTKINGLKLSRAERDDERNPYTEQIQTLRRNTQKLEVTLRELKEDQTLAAQKIERTKFWVKGFKEVQLQLITEVLQELELVTNSVLAEVGLHDWNISYAVERETKSGAIQQGLTVFVRSPANDHEVKWEVWSGGESQRLRVVGALALSEVLLSYAGVSPNLEVLDEPTQHLSPEGVADLCSFLSTRAKRLTRGIWLIDHTAREGIAFAGFVTVVKTKKGSTINQKDAE